MNFDWIIAPITQEVFLGVGLLASLGMWIGARAESRRLSGKLDALRDSCEASLKEVAARIDTLREEQASEPVAAPVDVMAAHGVNLTTRTKVLRMHRRGESAPTISAALGVNQEEIELLLKLDRMLEPALTP